MAGTDSHAHDDEDAPADYEWLQEQLRVAGLHEEDYDDEDGPQPWNDPTGGTLTEVLEACEQGDTERLAQLLKDLTVDVNTAGPDGDTALHLACLYGHLSCAQALLDNGADVNAVNEEDGSTALHDAAAGGYLDICQLIIGKADQEILNKADEDGETPLHVAARGNHADVVRLLLSKGSDPTRKSHSGNAPCDEAEEEDVIALLRAVA